MRHICEAPGYEEEFLEDVQRLSPDCAASLYFYLGALEGEEEPEVAGVDDPACDLCGVIDLRYEVFCAKIPGCRSHRLILTIDRKADKVFVHSVLKGRKRKAEKAYQIAAQQLKLSGKPWEPRHGAKT